MKNLYVANFSTPGEAFGEMSLFLDHKRTASLVAEKDSNLYVVPYNQLSEFAKSKCPDIFTKIAQSLSSRLAETLQRLIRLENLIQKAECRKTLGANQDDLEESVDEHIKDLQLDIKNITRTADHKTAALLAPYCRTHSH